ncbi:MAG: UDP-3-O-(3-hydroxymyristoyl)glucosamine N-acyltransferase [Candidatus Krumholzibacteriia bacterium]
MPMSAVRLSELASALGLTCEGDSDPLIRGAAGIEIAAAGQITFVDSPRFARHLEESGAAAVILRPGVATRLPCLRTADPHAAFAAVLARFAPPRERIFPAGVHPTAVVDPTAVLGHGVAIGPYAVVGAGARLGDACALGAHVVIGPDAVLGAGCTLYPHAVVREECVLGVEVIVHAGAVVGSDGFGYLPGAGGLRKIPQIGNVVLEDRVEVGANACVDRAQTDVTRVGRGSKIDNLVQVGHNVVIGQDCALSAQCGISGSSVLGDRVVMGGQAGCGDHLRVGNDVKVGAQSGLDRDLPAGAAVFGYPAVERRRAFRLIALTHRLPEFVARLRSVEAALGLGGPAAEEKPR